ncbi:MAG: 50S ribosomal protein L1 [Desulfurococcales archaeon ex4484_58]|nr:MAG: 50S ribosomal protein L1 [Desulfurococcales archaeon ex4484_58]
MPMPTKEELREAIRKAIEYSPPRNFKQSVELVVVFKDIDLKSPEGRIRETIYLPKGRGKELNICVVADGEMAVKARELGVKRVITSNELREIDKKTAKKIAEECDWVLVRTDLMAHAGRILGPALGPRGKIPVPVPPNADIASFINRYKSMILVRNKDQPQVMAPIGTIDMDPDDLVENAYAILSLLESKLPNGAHNIFRVIVKTTMGPPVPVVG